MKFLRKILKIRYFVILLVILCSYMFLRTRKCYNFYDINGDTKTYFTVSQLKDLDKTDSILALAIGNAMYRKNNDVSFFIFSHQDNKSFKVNSIRVIYDGKEKEFSYNTLYNLNFENLNFKQKVSYNAGDKVFNGYKIAIIPPFMNFQYCWINFYDLFKWKYNKIGCEFDVKLIVNYALDNQQFIQELNYKVKCEESYPVNLLQGLLYF